MIVGFYSVHDKAVGAFLPPFQSRSDGEAARSFQDACLDPQHMFHKHAADYVLFRVGMFDDTSGGLVGEEPRRVIDGLTVQNLNVSPG